MAYTYEDFLNKMQAAGLTESQFSSYDLDLARQNPEAGIGLINAKYNYVNAQTDDERALANAEAEGIRTKYGNYTGGQYGTGYTPQGPAPSSFEPPPAPEPYSFSGEVPTYSFNQTIPTYQAPDPYQNQYAEQQKQLLDAMMNYKPFEYPDYQNQYADKQKELLDLITGYGPFNFDPATSPLYSSYKKQYTREGNRAMQDTLGAMAAATGGRPSTAAVAAAGQANDYYMSQLGDKLPQIYEQEYNKYLQDFGMLRDKFTEVNRMEGMDYSRYWDGKNFDYAKFLDDYARLQSNLGAFNEADDRAFGRYTDQRDFDYGRYLDQLGQYNTDRNFSLDKYQVDLGQYNADRNQSLAEYQTRLGQYNTDRNFGYGQLLDQIAYNNGIYDRQRQADETAYNRGLDAWEQQFKFNESAATQKEKEFNRMMETWKATGRASQEVADYFGVNVGDQYGGAESELALEQARADIAYTNQRIKESQSAEAKNYTSATGDISGGEDSAIDAALDRLYTQAGTMADIQLLVNAGYSEDDLREVFPSVFKSETVTGSRGLDWREKYDDESLKKVSLSAGIPYDIITEEMLKLLVESGGYTSEVKGNKIIIKKVKTSNPRPK